MAFSTLIPKVSAPFKTDSAKGLYNFLASQKNGIIADHFSLAGLIFDYSGEVKTELNTDITDHYTENNAAVQDHAALQPIRVVMKGLIGELVRGFSPSGLTGVLQNLQTGISIIPGYLGAKSAQALSKTSKAISQAQNISNQISEAASKGASVYRFFKDGVSSSTRQGKFYVQLEGLWEQRTPFTVQTPHKIYDNMLIESMVALQPEDTKYLSEFTVTLKQIRFASITTITTPSSKGVAQWEKQRALRKNNGLNNGSKLDLGLLPSGGGF